ncbi:MAG: SBBP repeat-containing protein [Acidobacteriota bacterium]|nr:SBBP repeat-containing protein [Acidobacteriota bacterium]
MNPRAVLILALVFAPAAHAQVDFQPLATSNLTGPLATVPLPGGTVLFVGSIKTFSTDKYQIALQQFVPPNVQNPAQIATPTALATGGNDRPYAAAIDPTGNIWIAGTTDSDDFNVVSPILGQKIPYRTAGFVLELDPAGKNVLFASTISGHQPTVYGANDSGSGLGTSATSICVDSAGNVYVGGNTDESDFLTTPGAYRGSGGYYKNALEYASYTYLIKISPARKLLYSTLIATGTTPCTGGSACLYRYSGSGSVVALAADSTGSAIVGALYSGGVATVSKVAPDGSKILWSIQPGSDYGHVLNLSLAQDSTGAIDILGQYFASATTIGGSGPVDQYQDPGLFAAKSSPAGTLTYSKDLGKSSDSNIVGVALDASGNAYFAGRSSSPVFPILGGVPQLGADFVLRLSDDGTTPQTLLRFPTGTLSAPPAFQNGLLLLPGAGGSLLRVPPANDFTKPAIVGYANAASFRVAAGLFPGALASLFGWGLPSSTDGVRITINGQNAPVLYAGPNQINFQVPFFTAYVNAPLAIEVRLPSQTLTFNSLLTRSLGIFTVDGTYAAALNQDGTVNSASNPAARGSVVSLFGTGALWVPSLQTGAVATGAISAGVDRPQVSDRFGTPAPVLYFGTAPGLNDGVFQLNVQLPTGVSLPLTLADSSFYPSGASNPVQLYIR